MERKSTSLDRERYNRTRERAEKTGGLAGALWGYAANSYGLGTFSNLWNALAKVYGKSPAQLKTPEEFWHPKVVAAVEFLTDKTFVKDMQEITKMRMEGQFSKSMWRRSYRSSDFGYHASWAASELANCIYFYHYKENVKEMLFCEHDWVRGFEAFLALRLRRKDPEILSLIEDALAMESSQILLSGKIIRAVIISGNEDLLDRLMKLLLAAQLQEGLRQQILENADAGSMSTLARILKVCLDEDLFRFSSATRAFDVWTGLGYGDARPAVVKKAAAFAYECLTDETIRQKYINSENNLEAYFAMWGMGCHEIADTDAMVIKLLSDEKKYRRILGWLFVSRADSSSFQMNMAMRCLSERDEEILAWIITNLSLTREVLTSYTYGVREFQCIPVQNSDFPADGNARKELFYKLKEIALFIGNRTQTFTGNPFAFTSVTLENVRVISCMMSVAGYDMNGEMIDELARLLPLMDADQRRAFYKNFLQPETNLKDRAYLREGLNDRSIHVKELAVQRLSKCTLNEDDLRTLSESLRSKSSSLRKSVLSIFREQKPEALGNVIEKMLVSQENYEIQAGIELLLYFRESQPEILEKYRETVAALRGRKLTTQTTILLDQLLEEQFTEKEAYSEENGFGLYDPKTIDQVMEQLNESHKNQQNSQAAGSGGKGGFLNSLFKGKESALGQDALGNPLMTEKELKAMIPSWEETKKILDAMNQVFARHADYEYEVYNWDGSKSKILFGNAWNSIRVPAEYGTWAEVSRNPRLSYVPFYEEFMEALGVYGKDVRKMLGLYSVLTRYSGDHSWNDMILCDWFAPIEKKGLNVGYHSESYQLYRERSWQMVDILSRVYQHFEPSEVFREALNVYQSMIALVGEENLGREFRQQKTGSRTYHYSEPPKCYPMNYKMIGVWRGLLSKTCNTPEEFQVWFLTEFRLERLSGTTPFGGLDMESYFKACDQGLIPKDVLYEKLLLGGNANTSIQALTNPVRYKRGKDILETCDWASALVDRMVHRIVEVESLRGELPTPLTQAARGIERFEGARHFCDLLAALGKENFFRGYEYSQDTTKRAILSRLLKRCYPSREDTPEKLKELLKKTDMKEKRLVEAVMYAPQWAGFAEEILGWSGLRCGVWFFHAHINERFSAEKETETAIYSPITPQQFNDGAFDKDWFFKAYEQLGEKRFDVLYKSAKYITAGSNQHRRSQLYSDAVLGKFDAEELKKEIEEKRNQEKLRCYPLIPIAKDDSEEALRRYEFIQKFLKESRQFGAQRRDSEKKACITAMENLAITTGFMDVNRMTWYLESEKLEEIRPMMEPRNLDGVMVWMEIEEDGDAQLAIEKNGKRQKTLPKSLNKNETILQIKETIKELKEQKRRAKESLERAMTEATAFGTGELEKIMGNPVLSPLVRALVWTDGSRNGFLEMRENDLYLRMVSGEQYLCTDVLRIAHPHDMKVTGEWAAYMHLLYEQKLVQPFKQVFREYYPITEDERQEKTISRRYAGHQVQPQKTAALLKSRGWTVDYEEGLQKVYYKENLIVRMYALADWFSPADIEAPTLETIQFYYRDSGECAELESIPPILFSEAMRDMDLVVSVAHVGGVDPEASHSTVEMRTAIAAELVKLLKLPNVEFIGSHAKIRGSLSNYSIHMGSGVVHAEASGMVAILPVHSQARGRMFLPFADDDPKTAEIMSKIILLAEDKKIKDPSILRQI